MPSRRDLIKMTPQEVTDYLLGQSRIILVTIGSDGMPHPVPMNYGLDPEGRIVITSFRKSQKVKNLERDPRATLLVESGDSYDQLKSVILWAEAEVLTEPDEVRANMAHVRADAALSGSMSETMGQQVAASIAKRVVLRFTPFRMASWDHSKLGRFY